MVRKAEWWLDPTTGDQCRQNTVCVYVHVYIQSLIVFGEAVYCTCTKLCAIALHVAITATQMLQVNAPASFCYLQEVIKQDIWLSGKWQLVAIHMYMRINKLTLYCHY